MSESPICIRVEVMPERRPNKPRGVAVAAAMGRAPLLSDLDAMPPPRGAMLPYPPAPGVAAECAEAARVALAMNGTAVLFTTAHQAAEAERWLAAIAMEATR